MKATFLFLLLSTMAIAQNKVKVACVGNSITEGFGIEDGKTYPKQLSELLGENYDVRNYGLSGRTLLKKGDFPYWLEEKYKEVLAWNPDIVIIKLGTNDAKPQNWIYADDFESDYKEFIRSFKKLSGKKKIYICLPVPVFKELAGISDGTVKEEVIPKIKAVGKSESVHIIDLYSAFKNKGDLLPDGVHPNSAGATVIAEEVYGAIKT
jgi:acyl-CoA thioesterase-1